MTKHNEPISLFIVDDDRTLIKTLKNEIRKNFPEHNIHIFAFETMADVERMIGNQPDIALVGYHLGPAFGGGVNGISIIDLLKEQSPETEIILFTERDNSRIAAEAYVRGALEYVVKNQYMFSRLRVALEQCIKLRELKREIDRQNNRGAIALAAIALLLGAITLIQLFAPELLQNTGFA